MSSPRDYPTPPTRRFRAYAFDPRAALSPETTSVNELVISLPWEEPYEKPLGLGPSGEYVEVVDYDAPAGVFYLPLDPNNPHLLAQDGLPPSEGRPQFHQQMVYAVAMKTIRGFERALGRKVLWASSHKGRNGSFIRRLRIYPHALAEANAYYSPDKTALLFGYFRDQSEVGDGLPGGWVFTCLSHDIIAHETAHALLHGIHRRSIDSNGPDAIAFHEAFSDIVALLQHFTMPEVVAQQIAATKGRLRLDSLLSGLAGQFGQATRVGRSLRSGIDASVDEQTGRVHPPDARLYQTVTEPHAKGAILVGAIFDTFLTIFENRTADLLRLVLGSSSPTGAELPRELVNRLAAEAARSAEHVLRMCVRGLDLLPVTEITFGEFLRAVVTADIDLVPEDPLGYRVILADAFRRRGIFEPGWPSMAPDSLKWDGPDIRFKAASFKDLLKELDLVPRFERYEIWKQEKFNRGKIEEWLDEPDDKHLSTLTNWERLLGVQFSYDTPLRSIEMNYHGWPDLEVHTARIARRTGPSGRETRELFVEITQQRYGFDSTDEQSVADKDEVYAKEHHDFIYVGGTTLVIDLTDGQLRYAIRKRIDDPKRLDRQRQWRAAAQGGRLAATYFDLDKQVEPFALAHRI